MSDMYGPKNFGKSAWRFRGWEFCCLYLPQFILAKVYSVVALGPIYNSIIEQYIYKAFTTLDAAIPYNA